jgi:hypothetical protein
VLQPPPSHHLSLTIFLADSATQRLNALSTAAKPTWLHTCAASARLNNALSRPAQYAQLFFVPPPVAPELPPTKYSQKLAINTAHTSTLLLHSVNSILLFYSDIVHDKLHPAPQTLSASLFKNSPRCSTCKTESPHCNCSNWGGWSGGASAACGGLQLLSGISRHTELHD